MKNKLALITLIGLLFSFKPLDNDKILRTLIKQSHNIVLAKITEIKRCVRMEDGIEECIYSFKIVKTYEGKSLKTESTFQTTIMSYAFVNTNGTMPIVDQEFVLFLDKETKDPITNITSFKLVDNWMGIQKHSGALEKLLSECTTKK